VPNYQEIDNDPRWHQWLRQVDPHTGWVRQELLNEAIAAGSGVRVVAFFKGFLREAGQTGAAPVFDWGPGQVLERRQPRPQGPVDTRDQVKHFYELHRKGKFIGREDEWARLEHEIIRAGREGRILAAWNRRANEIAHPKKTSDCGSSALGANRTRRDGANDAIDSTRTWRWRGARYNG
jgi:hypothetical protein